MHKDFLLQDVVRIYMVRYPYEFDRTVRNGSRMDLTRHLQDSNPVQDYEKNRIFHLFLKSNNEQTEEDLITLQMQWMQYMLNEGGCDHVPSCSTSAQSLGTSLYKEQLYFHRWVGCVDKFELSDYKSGKCVVQFCPTEYLSKTGISNADSGVLNVVNGFLQEANRMCWSVTIVPSSMKRPTPWNRTKGAYNWTYKDHKPHNSLIIDWHVFYGKNSGACALVTRKDQHQRPKGVVIDCDVDKTCPTQTAFRNHEVSAAASHGRLQAMSDQIGWPQRVLLQEHCAGMQTSGNGVWWFLHVNPTDKEHNNFMEVKKCDPFVRHIQHDLHLDILGPLAHFDASPIVFCIYDDAHKKSYDKRKRAFVSETCTNMDNLILLNEDGQSSWLLHYLLKSPSAYKLAQGAQGIHHATNEQIFNAHNWRLLQMVSTVMKTMSLSNNGHTKLRCLMDVQESIGHACHGEELCLVQMCTTKDRFNRHFAYLTREFYQHIVAQGLLCNRNQAITDEWKCAMEYLSQWYGLDKSMAQGLPCNLGLELHAGRGVYDAQIGLFFDLDGMPPLYFRSADTISLGICNLIELATWKVLAESKDMYAVQRSSCKLHNIDQLSIVATEAYSPTPHNAVASSNFNMHILVQLRSVPDNRAVAFENKEVAQGLHSKIVNEFQKMVSAFVPILPNWHFSKDSKAQVVECAFVQCLEKTENQLVAKLTFQSLPACPLISCRHDSDDNVFVYTLAVNQIYTFKRVHHRLKKTTVGKHFPFTCKFYHQFDENRIELQTPAVVPEQRIEHDTCSFNIQQCCTLYVQMSISPDVFGMVKCEFVNEACMHFSECQCQSSMTYDPVTMEALSYLSRRGVCDKQQGKNSHVRASSFCHLQDASGVNLNRLYVSNNAHEFSRNSTVFLCGVKPDTPTFVDQRHKRQARNNGFVASSLQSNSLGSTDSRSVFVLNLQPRAFTYRDIQWADLTNIHSCDAVFLFKEGQSGAVARQKMRHHVFKTLCRGKVSAQEAKNRCTMLLDEWGVGNAKVQAYPAGEWTAYRATLPLDALSVSSERYKRKRQTTYPCYIKAIRTAKRSPFSFTTKHHAHKTGGGPYCTFTYVQNKDGTVDHAQLSLGCWNSSCKEAVGKKKHNRMSMERSMTWFYF